MLIKCKECGHDVSSMASACPNCGCPISIQDVNENQIENNKLVCPDFPSDLDIGGKIKSKNNYLSCIFHSEGNSQNILVDGAVLLLIYQNGLHARGLKSKIFNIHKSQIIAVEQLSQQEIVEKQKSVISRAIIGGVLTGGIGAIVGGMSGIGSKKQKIDAKYIVINFWNVETKSPQQLILQITTDATTFINTLNQQF